MWMGSYWKDLVATTVQTAESGKGRVEALHQFRDGVERGLVAGKRKRDQEEEGGEQEEGKEEGQQDRS